MPREAELFAKLLILIIFPLVTFDFLSKGLKGIIKGNTKIYKWTVLGEADVLSNPLDDTKEVRGARAKIIGSFYTVYGLLFGIATYYVIRVYVFPI